MDIFFQKPPAVQRDTEKITSQPFGLQSMYNIEFQDDDGDGSDDDDDDEH